MTSTLEGRHYNTQGSQLLCDWSLGDWGGGATATREWRLHQIKVFQSSATHR